MKKFGLFLVALCCFSLFLGCAPEEKKPAPKADAGAKAPDAKPAAPAADAKK